ncbi:MAG: N-acetylmuramoyl-L-alanine amidase [bacterium]|nr:N-acetylmuramoyl-L-alanine amidase [bacterium]
MKPYRWILILVALLVAPVAASRVENVKIAETLLPYNQNLEKRDTGSIDMIVVHCTELPDLEEAREYGERILYQKSRTGNSGHFYIDKDGTIYRYVEDNRVAHHTKGYNGASIGIEIVNAGRYPNWFHSKKQVPSEKYTDAQVRTTIALINHLKRKYPGISKLKRHSDLDKRTMPSKDSPTIRIRRKIDPGPLFPWNKVLKACGGSLREQ